MRKVDISKLKLVSMEDILKKGEERIYANGVIIETCLVKEEGKSYWMLSCKSHNITRTLPKSTRKEKVEATCDLMSDCIEVGMESVRSKMKDALGVN